MRHTHDTTFSEKILDFYKILEESEQFFILFLKKMENLRRFFSIFEVRGDKFFFNVVWLNVKYDHFFIAKLIIFVAYVNWALFFSIGLQCMYIEQVKTETNLSCLNKKKMFSKVKELFMCFYVICMNKHMGITLSVFLLVL